jgi:virulence factor Mce-like protein
MARVVDTRPGAWRRPPKNFRVGAIVLAVTAVFTYLGFTKDIPFVNSPYEISAAFRDSSGIRPGSPVRIAGVEVGKVSSVDHTSKGSRAAVVKMQILNRGRPLHADAEASIRPRIFLEGNFFVELQPGTGDTKELKDGATIPADQTTSAVQLDQVLKVLKADLRTDLQDALSEIGKTEDAGGARVLRDSLDFQPAAYKFTAIVADALLGQRPGDLGDFVRDQGKVSAALDADPAALRDLITNFDRTAAALASRQADLRAGIAELPRTLQAALPALAALNAAFPAVRAFARAAVPGVRSTGPTARALTPLVAQLRGLVSPNELRGLSADLRAATPPLTKVATTSVPLLEQVRALSSCTAGTVAPALDQTVPDAAFPPTGPAFQEIAKSWAGLAGESRSFDANGQWFKVLGEGGPDTLTLGNGLFGTASGAFLGVNPPAQHTRPPLEPTVPCETQDVPDLRTKPGPGPARARGVDPNAPAAKARAEKARTIAIDLLRRALRREGADVPVIDRDATMADIRAIAKRNGKLAQLDRLLAGKKAGG